MVKSSGKRVHTLAEAIPLYKNNEVYFGEHGSDVYEGAVEKLYVVFENDNTIPSFRQETAFALSWIQSVNDSFGFSLTAQRLLMPMAFRTLTRLLQLP